MLEDGKCFRGKSCIEQAEKDKEGRRKVGWQGWAGEPGAGIIEKVRCEQSLKAVRDRATQRWGKKVAGPAVSVPCFRRTKEASVAGV